MSEFDIRVDAAPVELPTGHVVPLGLLVVELVTNAIKHSDPPDGNQGIDVGFIALKDGRLELTVRDHGRGMPEGFTVERAGRGLGMTVIRGLARQLDAELAVGNAEPGARWRVILPAYRDMRTTGQDVCRKSRTAETNIS